MYRFGAHAFPAQAKQTNTKHSVFIASFYVLLRLLLLGWWWWCYCCVLGLFGCFLFVWVGGCVSCCIIIGVLVCACVALWLFSLFTRSQQQTTHGFFVRFDVFLLVCCCGCFVWFLACPDHVPNRCSCCSYTSQTNNNNTTPDVMCLWRCCLNVVLLLCLLVALHVGLLVVLFVCGGWCFVLFLLTINRIGKYKL